MESLADLLNSPTPVTFEGRTYNLRQPTVTECGEYQRLLEQEARAAAGRANELPEAMRRQVLSDVIADIASNRYRWGGELCAKSLQTVDGLARLIAIICKSEGMNEELALRFCNQRLKEIMAVIASGQMNQDPKAQALIPVMLASLGLAPDFLNKLSNSSSTNHTEVPKT